MPRFCHPDCYWGIGQSCRSIHTLSSLLKTTPMVSGSSYSSRLPIGTAFSTTYSTTTTCNICLSTRFTAGFFLYPTLSVREVGASAGGRVVPGIGQKVDNCKGKPGKRKKPKTARARHRRNRPAGHKKSIVLLGHPGPEPRGDKRLP